MPSSLFLISVLLMLAISGTSAFFFRSSSRRTAGTVISPRDMSSAPTGTTALVEEPASSIAGSEAPEKRPSLVPKVPANLWRFPPAWPFPKDYLEPVTDFSRKEITDDFKREVMDYLSNFVTPGAQILEISTDDEDGILQTFAASINSQRYQHVSIDSFYQQQGADYANFDFVVVTSGLESLLEPRSFFKPVWRSLQPQGECHLIFLNAPGPRIVEAAKMWTTMTVEQRIWIAGAYLQYSVDQGWEGFEGFDVLDKNGTQLVFKNSSQTDSTTGVVGSDQHLYAVRGKKAPRPASVSNVSYDLLTTDHTDFEDRQLAGLRLTALGRDTEARQLVTPLSQIYKVLADVADTVIPKCIKAMFVTLVIDRWTNSPAQIEMIRKGLGVEGVAGDPFWGPVGTLTAQLPPKEKMYFLADVVRQANSADRLTSFPDALQAVYQAISNRAPTIDEAAKQLLATDLCVSEFLEASSKGSVPRILAYIQSQSETYWVELAKSRLPPPPETDKAST